MLTDVLNLTSRIQQLTNARTSMGGVKKEYSTRLSDVPCSFKSRLITESDS